MANIVINNDAFSSGQISSKLWMCQELEKLENNISKKIWIFGGWYGISALLLLSREIILIDHIRSFDIDPTCQPLADIFLENWVWQNWKFKSFTKDCNHIIYDESPDIIINTSTEHFDSKKWFDNIPDNTTIVLQSNNMKHADHKVCFQKLDDFIDFYPVKQLFYKGQLNFKYPDWEFSRYMVIGKK